MNVDQLQYILLIITGAIAVVGTLIKTKSDNGNPQFYNLTKGGIILILLSVFVISLNIFIQYSRNQNLLLEKQKQRNTVVQDSLVTTNRYTFDSISHQLTINGLLTQRQFDSDKIKTDSSRYGVTLKKLSEQLQNQQTTLSEINKILNPLFPLKVQFGFTTYTDSTTPKAVGALFEKIIKQYPQGYKNENNYLEIDDYKIEYSAIYGYDILNKKPLGDTLFNLFNSHLIKLCPDISVEFFDPKISEIDARLKFQSVPAWNFSFKYTHPDFNNLVDFTITGIVNDENIVQNLIYSINELNGNDVFVDFKQKNGNKLPLHITSMHIYTGINFQNEYSIGVVNDENSFERAFASKIVLRKKIVHFYLPWVPG